MTIGASATIPEAVYLARGVFDGAGRTGCRGPSTIAAVE